MDWFGDYARVVFSAFAGRVKTWITINEAISVCDYSYNTGNFAPGIKEPEFAPYMCNKNILLAHAMAYRIYEREFKRLYEGWFIFFYCLYILLVLTITSDWLKISFVFALIFY